MEDIVLITSDSVRSDYFAEMNYLSSLNHWNGTSVAHYTRPSLAGLLSSSYLSAMQSAIMAPTLPEVLHSAGYTTIGIAPSPQLDPVFDFDRGFEQYDNFANARTRGNPIRERLSNINLLRQIYHRVFPPHAKQDNLPRDEEIVEQAITQFNSSDQPRFMWIHLMGTHRPYGRDGDAVPEEIDRKAIFSPKSLSTEEHELITQKYREALEGADSLVEYLLTNLNSDPLMIFTSDHGDEFGEHNRYFHQPQRKQLADKIISVPVASNRIDINPEHFSLLDIGPLLVDHIGADIPKEWDGVNPHQIDRNSTISIAPWQNSVNLRIQYHAKSIFAKNCEVTISQLNSTTSHSTQQISGEIQQQLRELGYIS